MKALNQDVSTSLDRKWLKKKILVIDYDQYFLKNAKQSLEQIGNFAVTTVSGIDDALHLVDHHPFDAIISDNDRIRGIDLLKFLRKKNDTTPFIFFTAKGR